MAEEVLIGRPGHSLYDLPEEVLGKAGGYGNDSDPFVGVTGKEPGCVGDRNKGGLEVAPGDEDELLVSRLTAYKVSYPPVEVWAQVLKAHDIPGKEVKVVEVDLPQLLNADRLIDGFEAFFEDF
ncbi:MAG: hypothetical protein DRO87_12245 [Candidatus Thorarchaeota archaeon]|nr:MAG: hypothetical protein DRO87_12245 [Candidatus Thorarchaeota archaeon]